MTAAERYIPLCSPRPNSTLSNWIAEFISKLPCQARRPAKRSYQVSNATLQSSRRISAAAAGSIVSRTNFLHFVVLTNSVHQTLILGGFAIIAHGKCLHVVGP